MSALLLLTTLRRLVSSRIVAPVLRSLAPLLLAPPFVVVVLIVILPLIKRIIIIIIIAIGIIFVIIVLLLLLLHMPTSPPLSTNLAIIIKFHLGITPLGILPSQIFRLFSSLLIIAGIIALLISRYLLPTQVIPIGGHVIIPRTIIEQNDRTAGVDVGQVVGTVRIEYVKTRGGG